MNSALSGHFLPGPAGALATIVLDPPHGVSPRFGVLYLPPFGDEMNKSRRMATLAARAFALLGASVALVDLRGTGDSEGEHGQATWEAWKADAAFAWRWLCERTPGPHVLWGLRLGGLLAANLIADRAIDPAALLLWQPVTSGRVFFQQLLRLASAQRVTGGTDGASSANAPREALNSGRAVEVGGYELHPALVSGAERFDFVGLAPGGVVIWREISIATPPELSAAARSLSGRWMASDAHLDIEAVAGPSFWVSAEIEEAPELIASTSRALVTRLLSQRHRAS